MKLLGKLSNNLSMGIVGLPNIGKSFFFNAVTNSTVPSENYPFTTIDPSEAKAALNDERLSLIKSIYNSNSITNAHLSIFDIAGLVKGAHKGQGLGNQFLSNIKSTNGLFHLVRAFDDSKIDHVEGNTDPIRDLIIIHDELRLKDQMDLEKLDVQKKKKISQKENSSEIIDKIQRFVIDQNKDVRSGIWTDEEVDCINTLDLITAKPVVYLVNMSMDDYFRDTNKYFNPIQSAAEKNNPGDLVIPYSGIFEGELASMETIQDRKDYLNDIKESYKLKTVNSKLNEIITSGFRALNLIYFFTAGPQEIRCWTVREGTKAPQAAKVIHTDFEKNFIAAEVLKYSDLLLYGSEEAVKMAGKVLTKGKDYAVQDGDIIFFKINKTVKK